MDLMGRRLGHLRLWLRHGEKGAGSWVQCELAFFLEVGWQAKKATMGERGPSQKSGVDLFDGPVGCLVVGCAVGRGGNEGRDARLERVGEWAGGKRYRPWSKKSGAVQCGRRVEWFPRWSPPKIPGPPKLQAQAHNAINAGRGRTVGWRAEVPPSRSPSANASLVGSVREEIEPGLERSPCARGVQGRAGWMSMAGEGLSSGALFWLRSGSKSETAAFCRVCRVQIGHVLWRLVAWLPGCLAA